MARVMSASETISALRRKAAVGRQVYQARAMTGARALRLSLPKAGDDLFDMALGVIGLTHRRLDRDAAIKVVRDDALLMLLDGADGRPGAAIVDMSFAGALVQQQTMGRVTDLPEGAETRKPTRTEAMLFAPLVDATLSRAAPLPEIDEDAEMLGAVKFGAWIESPRLLDIALEDDQYEHFSITVDIASGTRQGRFDLILPLPQAQAPAALPDENSEEPMARVAMGLEAVLSIALTRLDMTLADVSALKPGDTLPIPMTSFDNAEIVTITGRRIGRGKLGQVDGKRALRPDIVRPAAATPQRRAGDDVANMPAFDGGPQRDLIDMPPLADDGGLPDMAGLPDIGGMPETPSLPDLPEANTTLDMPDMGDLPELSETDELPALPDMDDLPGLSDGADDLPDLPDMSDLPDLEDLPELPDLAVSNG